MNILYVYLLKNLNSLGKEREFGFTLTELLIVVIILGVLSLMAIPTFIEQVGKAREAETLGILGAISRSQQAYHWEHGRFADDISILVGGNSNNLKTNYHEVTEDVVTVNTVTYKATIINTNEQVRNFALGVYYVPASFGFGAAICRSNQVGGTVNVGASQSDPCVDGTKLK